jgi:hypothetical protein
MSAETIPDYDPYAPPLPEQQDASPFQGVWSPDQPSTERASPWGEYQPYAGPADLSAFGVEETPTDGVVPSASEQAPPNKSYAETIAFAEINAMHRSQEALEASEFVASPEVQDAMEGYYGDHYKLADTIGYIVEHPGFAGREAADSDADAGRFDTHGMKQAASELLALDADGTRREETLKEALHLTDKILFGELSLGTTTVSKEEAAMIASLNQKIRQAAINEGMATEHHSGRVYWQNNDVRSGGELRAEERIDEISMLLQRRADQVWADSRHAGQLLFHNTGNLTDIMEDGHVLRSRTGQVAQHGSFNAETVVMQGKSHTNVPHFSERYDWRDYKSASKTGERHPGTIAIPLSEVIKQAPYARNSRYATVGVKDPASLHKVTINEDVGSIGVGGNDAIGANGGDRVFFADNRADHEAAAHDYEMSFGAATAGAEGNTGRIVLTQHELERWYADKPFSSGPDAPVVDVLPFQFDSERARGMDPNVVRAWQEQEQAKLPAAISRLQHDSRNRQQYRGQVVVPLRNGVMEFKAENSWQGDPYGDYWRSSQYSRVDTEQQRQRQ